MDYGEILRRALAISWRHKYMWLLALFAGEGAGLSLPSFQRGPRGGADDFATGEDRRPPQLGLSLLLGARRNVDLACLDGRRVFRGGGSVA